MATDIVAEYVAERDKVFLRDGITVAEVKAFQERWRKRGVSLPVVSDMAMEVAIRKVQYNTASCPPDLLRKAKRWLIERGFSTEC